MSENDGQGGAKTDIQESEVETSASQVSEQRTMPNGAILDAMARAIADKSRPGSSPGVPVTKPYPAARAPLPFIPKIISPETDKAATGNTGQGFPMRPVTEGTVRAGKRLPGSLANSGTLANTQVQNQGRPKPPKLQIDTYVDDEEVSERTGVGEATGVVGESQTFTGDPTFVGGVTQIPTHVRIVDATHVGAEETAVETWMGTKLPGLADKSYVQGDEQTAVQDVPAALIPIALEDGGSGEVTNIVAGMPEIAEARARLFKSRKAGADTLPARPAHKEATGSVSAEPGPSPAQASDAPIDEVARGFPLPAPSEEIDDEHTEVQTGQFGGGFLPEEHGLGPGFPTVEAPPSSTINQRRPLPGMQGFEVATPKAAPVVKSVSVPAAWDSSAAQEVHSHRNLPPQEVALAVGLGSFTGFTTLVSNRKFVVVGLLIVVAGVLVAALLTSDRETMPSPSASLDLVDPSDAAPSQAVKAEEPMVVVADAQAETVNEDAHQGAAVTIEETPVEISEPPVSNTASAKELAKRGRTMFKKGKHLPALRLYKKAEAADASYAAVQLDLGQLYQRRGDWNLAVSSYRKYLELAPKAKDAQKVRKTIRRLVRR